MGRPRLHPIVIRSCICGTQFKTDTKRISENRGQFCSKKCSYENKTRKSGLKYKIVVENKGWYKENIIPRTAWKKGETAGDKNSNWKGGISSSVSSSKKEKQLLSTKIKKWKRQIFKRDGKICQLCGDTKNLEVDHIKPWKSYPELRFDLNNGRVLCHNCHKQTDSYGKRKQ